MHRKKWLFLLATLLIVRTSIGCGSSQPTVAVSKIATPDSPEFLNAQEEANRYHHQKQQEEAKQRARRRLPQGESNEAPPH